MRLAVCGLMLLTVLCVAAAAPNQELDPANPFTGLDGVTVYVEEPDSAFVQRGISRDVLQTPVELQLRQNGIPVLNEGDPGSTAGNPVLYVAISGVLDEAMHQYVYQIQMELTQTVLLERDPDTPVRGATTWRTGGVALSGPQWREALLTDLDVYTGRFLEEYLGANGTDAR